MKKIAVVLNGQEQHGCSLEPALSDFGYRIERITPECWATFQSWDDVELSILNQLEDRQQIVDAIDTIKGCSTARIVHYANASQEDQIIAALNAGADHLVPAPLTERVASLVVKALHRQELKDGDSLIRIGPLEIDTQGYQVRADGERLLLTLTEFKILALLARNPLRAVNREELRRSLSSGSYVMATRMIDYHILGLRKRLGRHKGLVRTVRGIGYQLRKSLSAT